VIPKVKTEPPALLSPDEGRHREALTLVCSWSVGLSARRGLALSGNLVHWHQSSPLGISRCFELLVRRSRFELRSREVQPLPLTPLRVKSLRAPMLSSPADGRLRTCCLVPQRRE
jgi:hypothetical protein